MNLPQRGAFGSKQYSCRMSYTGAHSLLPPSDRKMIQQRTKHRYNNNPFTSYLLFIGSILPSLRLKGLFCPLFILHYFFTSLFKDQLDVQTIS